MPRGKSIIWTPDILSIADGSYCKIHAVDNYRSMIVRRQLSHYHIQCSRFAH